MNSADRRKLRYIQTYCNDVVDFIDRFGKDFHIFINDKAYFNAVSMCIMQIGELANGLSEEFRTKTNSQIQWGLIRGMRNWMAHAYAEMDEKIIWETATSGISELRRFCEEELGRE